MKQIYFLPSSTSSSGGRSPLLSIDLPHKIPRRTVLRRLHPAISHDRHNVTGLLSRGPSYNVSSGSPLTNWVSQSFLIFCFSQQILTNLYLYYNLYLMQYLNCLFHIGIAPAPFRYCIEFLFCRVFSYIIKHQTAFIISGHLYSSYAPVSDNCICTCYAKEATFVDHY